MTIIASTVDPNVRISNSAGDYHQYTRPDQFVTQFDWFDNYPQDHLTLVGEYATVQPNNGDINAGTDWSLPRSPTPFWIGSVAEAVFSIGIERNSDKIIGASYAPLLQNMDGYQWTPDLISYNADTSSTTLSTSYHVIKLLASTRTTSVLPIVSDTDFNSTEAGLAFWVAGYNDPRSTYIVKFAIYNTTDGADVPFALEFPGAATTARITYLTAPSPYSANVFGAEEVVQSTGLDVVADEEGKFVFQLPQWSVAVLETQEE
ncbi:alpha-L-arabinofuranosidase [Phlyctema vagabunda]|uniref:Alpha-L-arabinofuranosidase n=1 Tax=Phlyctema vagabunda TaxID=108571 RepID=A0ABR4PYT6_9HELO